MGYLLSLIFLISIVFSVPRFALSSPYSSVCLHESDMFQSYIEWKCPLSMSPNPPLEVDGNFLDRVLTSMQGSAYTSVLFYASWCPFSEAMRTKFEILSSMFPQIEHLAVEQSDALPSVFSRYGIHSLPSVLMVNQTSRVRYRGTKDLSSLIRFYEKTTGLKPVQHVAEKEPMNMGNSNSWISQLLNGSSIKEVAKAEPCLAFAVMFVCLRMMVFVLPEVLSRMKAICDSYIPHLNLGIFGETSQLFGRVLHMIDVRRIWTKLRLCKTRNFHEQAKNARVWASSFASVSLGESSAARLSS